MCNNIKADIVCFYIIETEDKRLGAIVFYIIIIVAIVNISKKNQKNNSTSQNQGAGTKISSAPPRTNTVPPTNTTRTTTVTARPTTQNQAKPQQNKPAVNVQESTTEMLRKKAEEDQANHDKEKKLAEYKQKKSHMGKRYAQRYLIGDSVPKNMRIKCCGYCGAENLVAYGNREQLLCYFCREDLK